MLAFLTALTLFFSSGTTNQADNHQADQNQSTPLITTSIGQGRVLTLLDILSDEEKTSLTFELQSADGSTRSRALSFNNDGSSAELTDDSGKRIVGYSFSFDEQSCSLDLAYAGRTARISLSSDDTGPIQFRLKTKYQSTKLEFKSLDELDSAIALFNRVKQEELSSTNLSKYEAKLIEKASSLRVLAMRFLGRE